jgi:hypothetical protein
MAQARWDHTATLLRDGRVLVVGGSLTSPVAIDSAEIWDATTKAFEPTGSLARGRWGHTATLLPDDRVLIFGGRTGVGRTAGSPPSAELWKPAGGSFSSSAIPPDARTGHTATLLQGGLLLLIIGGDADWNTGELDGYAAAAELWDPRADTVIATGSPARDRMGHTATLLPDGRVLIVGGAPDNLGDSQLASAEVWDPRSGLFSSAGGVSWPRTGHTATLLPGGAVLVIGGLDSDARVLADAQTWDPDTGLFEAAGSLTQARYGHTATPLVDGRVLVVGGYTDSGGAAAPAPAELWDPTTRTFSPAGTLAVGRVNHTATLLPDGRVLMVGGGDIVDATDSAELFGPTARPRLPPPSTRTEP